MVARKDLLDLMACQICVVFLQANKLCHSYLDVRAFLT